MHDAINFHKNMSLREALIAARELGVDINHCHGTGDLCFWFPGRQMLVNCRRKDAPQALISKLRQFQKSQLLVAT
jgi:hypothetical protein